MFRAGFRVAEQFFWRWVVRVGRGGSQAPHPLRYKTISYERRTVAPDVVAAIVRRALKPLKWRPPFGVFG